MSDQVIDKDTHIGGELFLRITVRKSKIFTIMELRQAKDDLEVAINSLIWNFEQRTLCPVMKVDGVMNSSGAVYWTPTIKL